MCGKEVYHYQDYWFVKKKGSKYNFVHKECLKFRGDNK